MSVKINNITVLGAGSWGLTLALVAARAGRRVALWDRRPERAGRLQQTRRSEWLGSDALLPPNVTVASELSEACGDAEVVIFAVPSSAMRQTAAAFAGLGLAPVVVSAAKGLEATTLLRMTETIAEAVPHLDPGRIAAMSGPNLAPEIAAGRPAATVVAAPDPQTAETVRDALMTSQFRLYTHDDVVGVELGGALKNVIALGVGMGDTLDAGDNAKAAFITRGAAEIARMGMALGANQLTFAGLAGIGDLIATCASPLSRNRRAGALFAQGYDHVAVQTHLGQVAEGIATVDAAWRLAQRLDVDVPITERVRAVVWAGKSPLVAVAELMGREPRHELAGLRAVWPAPTGVDDLPDSASETRHQP